MLHVHKEMSITPLTDIVSIASRVYQAIDGRRLDTFLIVYCIARKVGGELNLAVCLSTAKLKSILRACMYGDTVPPNSNPPIMLYTQCGGKSAKFNDSQYFWLYGIS